MGFAVGQVLDSELLGLRAVWAWVGSPANIFLATIYTESLFAALTFTGLLLWLVGQRQHGPAKIGAELVAVFLFGCSSTVRSNGVRL